MASTATRPEKHDCFDARLQRISGVRMAMYGTVTKREVTAELISEMNVALRDGSFIMRNVTMYNTRSVTQSAKCGVHSPDAWHAGGWRTLYSPPTCHRGLGDAPTATGRYDGPVDRATDTVSNVFSNSGF